MAGLAGAVAWLSVVALRVRRPASELNERFNSRESVGQTKEYLAKVQSQLSTLLHRDSQSAEVEMTMVRPSHLRRGSSTVAIKLPQSSDPFFRRRIKARFMAG